MDNKKKKIWKPENHQSTNIIEREKRIQIKENTPSLFNKNPTVIPHVTWINTTRPIICPSR